MQEERSEEKAGGAIIEVEGLEVSFGGRKVLDGVSFRVERGAIYVVLGQSGCGKTTLLRCLVGAQRAQAGRVRLFGQDITRASNAELDELRKRFGMLFQAGALYSSMSVGENIAFSIREHTGLDESIIDIMVRIKLEQVNLRGAEGMMPSELSGGMRKRVAIARALALDPEILFYDEPTTGLDPVTAAVIDKLIVNLARKLQVTSLVVTHDMRSAFRIADRMILLHEGKIVGQGTAEEMKRSTNPIVRQFINGEPGEETGEGATPETYLSEGLDGRP
ncbi:MAG: ABC transporter ATP-binding protein [Planctomycetota bacterium]